MKIDFNQPIKALDGTPFLTEDKSPLILGKACIGALYGAYEDERTLTGEEKFKRFQLALLLHEAKEEVDLKLDEIMLLKKLTGKAYQANLVGPIWTMLEKS